MNLNEDVWLLIGVSNSGRAFHILARVVFQQVNVERRVESASSVGVVTPAQSAVSVGQSVVHASQL